jgi:uncharacterized delta-60 repeat protein
VWGATSDQTALDRFNTDGSPDTSFGSDGSGTVTIQLDGDAMIDRILPQPDGKVLITAETADGLAIARLNADGSIDTSFGGGMRVYDIFNGYPDHFVTEEDAVWTTASGKVLVMAMSDANVVTLRLNSEGYPDASFAPNGFVSAPLDSNGNPLGYDSLLAAQPQSDGSVIGYADLYAEDATQQIVQVRLDATGQITSQKVVDTALTAGTDFNIGWSPDFVVLFTPDGSAYVTSETTDPRIAKLNPDGVLDASYGDNGLVTLVGPYAQVLAVTPDGGAIVKSGPENTYYTAALDASFRLSPGGVIDQTFDGGQNAAVAAYPAYALPDGSVLFTYAAGGYDKAGNGLTASFVLQKVTTSPDDGLTNDPAALEVLSRVADKDMDPYAGLFASADGATIWNPDGDISVYDDPISAM